MIEIYTDGSCVPNPGFGGCAAVLKAAGRRLEVFCAYKYTTNNRMEMLAAIHALEAIKKPKQDITIYTDSTYLIDKNGSIYKYIKNVNNPKKNLTKTKPNLDLWLRLIPLLRSHNVSFQWVKGHASCFENNIADSLAEKAVTIAKRNNDFKIDFVYQELKKGNKNLLF